MNIILLGTGKMGNAVADKAIASGHRVIHRINHENRHQINTALLREGDVVIEFTRPDAAVENLYRCLEAGVPVVCGTTGWQDDYEEVRRRFIEADGSLLTATNFSIGVNILFQLNQQLAHWLKGYTEYKPALHEIHHTRKLDKPSGTAVTLASDLMSNRPEYCAWALSDKAEKPADYVLPIHSERMGDVIGVHEVVWNSPIDSISIRHEAHNRDGFVIGALLAAEWLQNRKGVFGMADVLFGKKGAQAPIL
ncbi:MAG: 4-hydroxy-tetrahydrodipicolinate reductase [Sphingobacteriales bacterium]|jgi:4-hydroxy-tetrahydrodipicolinate reductase|nr:4-hydroxy-tetrahydrodipicolinate reductase [Sphingobacteriales bacterium]